MIGSGGMADVYRATHRNGNRVAIKLLHDELSRSKEIRARFVREGYVANSVDHPGAVRVIDDDVTQDGAVFLVMELLEGETLHALAKRAQGTLELSQLIGIVRAVLGVLEAAHAKQIVHRDIKPDNIFLTTDGVVKVLDFGIARMMEPGSSSVTGTGRTMIGTPAYMAPEQALGRQKEIGPQTDLWAVGATMFALLSGRTVHQAESSQEMIVLTGSRPPSSLASVAPDVPQAIVAVVDRALAFDGQERWPSAPAMRTALDAASEGLVALPEPRAKIPSYESAAFAQTRASGPDVTLAAGPSEIRTGPRAKIEGTAPGVSSDPMRVTAPRGARAKPVLLAVCAVGVLVAAVVASWHAGREPRAASVASSIPVIAPPVIAPMASPVPSSAPPAEPAVAQSADVTGAPSAHPSSSSAPRLTRRAKPRLPAPLPPAANPDDVYKP